MKKTFHTQLNLKLLLPVLILGGISLITLASINSLLPDNVSDINYLPKQLIGFCIGLTATYIIYAANLKKAYSLIDLAYYILIVMLFILAFNPPIIGNLFVNNNNGANGWFMLFTPSISFQPVEFFKLIMVLKLANITQLHYEKKYSDNSLIKSYLIYGFLPIGLVLLEPDLGGTLLLLFTAFVMLMVSLRNKKLVKKILLILGLIILILIPFILFDVGQTLLVKLTPIQPYQLSRLDSWLNPFSTDGGYQLQQSLIFMGSAGPFGYGGGFSLIPISEPQTDLIFTSLVGFWGWLTGLFVIFLYFYIILTTLNVGEKEKSIFSQVTCIGFAALFFIQVSENIGMVIGLLPITGIVLPYISYGLSALITYLSILGVILNISRSDNN